MVTADEKEHWWWRHRSELLGPRVELTDELRNTCGRRLFMMRPIDLLKRETEGCEQADIIRVAAARGGTIVRDEIYQVCGYDDDRMLRGFTRPTARITAELQSAGIVAHGVEPALTPVYRGVRAEAFRIPIEMTAILTTEQDTQPEGEV